MTTPMSEKTSRFLRESDRAHNSLLGVRHLIERAGWEMAERDKKIAELEALLETADKMHDERLYELQQLQKRYIPNWEQQVEARIEAARRKDGE